MGVVLPIIAGLGVLGGITALVLGWHREPAGEALIEQDRPIIPDWRPTCWVDDPMYTALGHVSDDWLRSNRGGH